MFSVLRYGAYKNDGEENAPLVMRDVLNKLGMQEYLDDSREEFMIVPAGTHREEKNNLLLLERADAEMLCKAVFDRLIEIGLHREARGVYLKELIREVL